MAEWSKASVCGAEGPGIDLALAELFFQRDGDCEEGGREEREKWKKEKRGKRKGERTVKEKNFFFVIFLLIFLFNFYRLSL